MGKLTIQLPITGVQYSNRIMVLDENEQTPEEINKALCILREVDKQYNGDPTSEFAQSGAKPEAPKHSAVTTDIMGVELAQLKRSQELSQQFMSIFKYKNPELFEEITQLVDEHLHDVEANGIVDEKILDKDSN